VLLLVELAGGPATIRLLLKMLQDAGWKGDNSSVTVALKRNPQVFRQTGYGMYALNLGPVAEGVIEEDPELERDEE